ncbi:hypothetical protein HPB47_022921 [Ixodes persulcatus]|uniref:Uncharacterized protein n=1 Tax=Ixodes persulcatus TaxID=34615 RepID=A0AC60Q8U9_IXOPE|nr:hypothetical protein HPB47_022921 [Ixodes persulcatus]
MRKTKFGTPSKNPTENCSERRRWTSIPSSSFYGDCQEKGDVINRSIRESEVAEAIKKLSRIKAPGPDGIESEFDKLFFNALCPTLVRVFEEIRERKPLPPSMRESHTALIVAEVTGNRTTSLLCSDYKILVKRQKPSGSLEPRPRRYIEAGLSSSGDTLERTRRDNLFLHQGSGGLGLVIVVLKLQRFLLLRDAKGLAFAALHHLDFPYL